MKRMLRKNRNKRSVGKVVTGMVLGSVIGATVALLMAPASGQEIRRKITSQVRGVQEKAKSAAENVESRARDLAAGVSENIDNMQGSVTRRRKTVSPVSQG